jgi:hypothetical protein
MRLTEVKILIGGQEHSFGLSDTKATVIQKLGEPEDTGAFSRKHPDPRIFKYENTEFHFDFENRLVLIYREKEQVPAISIEFDDF